MDVRGERTVGISQNTDRFLRTSIIYSKFPTDFLSRKEAY